MRVPAPHFLLTADAPPPAVPSQYGAWRFVLQTENGSPHLEVAEAEPGTDGQRLELLAVVRGLEALPEPSRVTLLTPSVYVRRGLTYGLDEWRANDWRWECHGEMVPVKNGDLWRRVDRALQFHEVQCRILRVDAPHRPDKENGANSEVGGRSHPSQPPRRRAQPAWKRPLPACAAGAGRPRAARRPPQRRGFKHAMLTIRRRIGDFGGRWILKLRQLGSGFVPTAWLD